MSDKIIGEKNTSTFGVMTVVKDCDKGENRTPYKCQEGCEGFKGFKYVGFGRFNTVCDYKKKTKKDRLIEILVDFKRNSTNDEKFYKLVDEILAVMDEGK